MPRTPKPKSKPKPKKARPPALTPLEARRLAEKFGGIPECAAWLKAVAVRPG